MEDPLDLYATVGLVALGLTVFFMYGRLSSRRPEATSHVRVASRRPAQPVVRKEK